MVLSVAAVLALAGCGQESPSRPAGAAVAPPPRSVDPFPSTTPTPSGPTVQEIADALDGIAPLRHPRDNTGSCAATAGCLGLITGGAVSIYQWPSVTEASRFIGDGAGTADRIGWYVLSYRTTEQRSTTPRVRKAYADKVRALVGPVP